MSITLGYGHIVQLGSRQEKSIYCGMIFIRFACFFESASLRMRAILNIVSIGSKIITAIAELSSTDHNCNQTTDKRILYVTNAVYSIYLRWL
jgi:hypothetical protein